MRLFISNMKMLLLLLLIIIMMAHINQRLASARLWAQDCTGLISTPHYNSGRWVPSALFYS